MSTLYPFTELDLQNAFDDISETLFDKARDINNAGLPGPKILIIAGAQGSGKTYLLENKLLPSQRYNTYIHLYLPAFRKQHPLYAEMVKHGPLHAYEHTEDFIWKLGTKVFAHAFEHRYNIIMETALDDPKFADFPPAAVQAGYQFEVHLIACQKEFCHWATLDRATKSLAKNELERFVPLTKIEASQANAKAILDAFEEACTQVPGSQITMYQRGLETEMESKPLCHSTCETPAQLTPQADFQGQAFIKASPLNRAFSIRRNPRENAPCSYPQYTQVVHAGMIEPQVRQAMVKACCKTLAQAQELMPQVPTGTFQELSLYVLKYVHP
ncbi:MAG: zeta toxin family protein [Pseudomonas sp.]|uniref:zeta toxin family protein n=1 Tax=Pseudomonas abieticivorans TaxID=2931382 RepID=UPI0020C05CE7|nr:zeta toxin family protein [Pseudomonas sp. PIA16]MDE1166739.1 zeta toxin family protein [Pseudomonas sp.]